MEIDREMARQLRDEIDEAVQEVGQRHGLIIAAQGASYSSTEVSVKVVAKTGDADAATFKRNAELLGLTAEDYGRSVTVNGKALTLVGINLRNRKYPVIAEAPDGRRFKLDERAVTAALAR